MQSVVRATCLMLLAVCAVAVEPAATADPPRPRVTIDTDRGPMVCELYPDQAPQTVRTFLDLATGRRAWTDPQTGAQVQRPFYDGLVFHRVIKGFMIQGGCPLGTGTSGPGFTFADEINAESLGLGEEKLLTERGLHPQVSYPAMAAQVQNYLTERMRRHPATGQDPAAARRARQEALDGLDLRGFYEHLGYRYDDSLAASTRPQRSYLAMANSGPDTNGSQFFILVGAAPHLTGKHTVFGRVVTGMAVADAIASEAVDPQRFRPLEPVTIRSIRPMDAADAPDAANDDPAPEAGATESDPKPAGSVDQPGSLMRDPG
ncbi:MAG: peptidylprolyl isomerase [Planctomycetota bacterium]